MYIGKRDRDKTVFISHCGSYRFTRMLFGLKNVAATFGRATDVIPASVR